MQSDAPGVARDRLLEILLGDFSKSKTQSERLEHDGPNNYDEYM